MPTKETTSQYRRASEFAPGIGANLDEIQNKDVLLVDFSVGERPLNRRRDADEVDESADVENGYSQGKKGAEQTTIVYVTVAVDMDKFNPEDRQGTTKLFHAWSESLAEKLAEIPKENLPLVIQFKRVQTTGGFRVWTFE